MRNYVGFLQIGSHCGTYFWPTLGLVPSTHLIMTSCDCYSKHRPLTSTHRLPGVIQF